MREWIGSGKSDVGKMRSNNEDSIFVYNESIGIIPNIFIVADGMGGHNAGEVASSKAIEFFVNYLCCYEFSEQDRLEDIIESGMFSANKGVYNMSLANSEQYGMGTTFTVCFIGGFGLCYGHIGDTRIYVASEKGIRQITQDHTYVNELVSAGKMSCEQAREHPKRNILTRALGTDNHIIIDKNTVALSDDDTVVICSDGLSNMVSDDEIFQIAKMECTSERKLDMLIDLANNRGGFDNISVIII